MSSKEKNRQDIEKAKYFLKKIIKAKKKLFERQIAKKEIDSHLIELKKVPGISKTKRVENAVDELRDKLYEVVGKEIKLEKDNVDDSKKIEELQREVEYLKEIISGHKENVEMKRIGEIKKEIKNAEKLYKKLQKEGKNKRELNKINKKLEMLKGKLN